jgi:hypothetical protein
MDAINDTFDIPRLFTHALKELKQLTSLKISLNDPWTFQDFKFTLRPLRSLKSIDFNQCQWVSQVLMKTPKTLQSITLDALDECDDAYDHLPWHKLKSLDVEFGSVQRPDGQIPSGMFRELLEDALDSDDVRFISPIVAAMY